MRMSLHCSDHLLRFGESHRHARLAENMFTCFKCGDCDCGMEIRRSTNPNNIDVWFGNELRPVTVRFCIGNKLGTELFRAFVRGVADRNDSDILDFFQRRQVALFDDIPGADETYIQFSAMHWHGMLCLTRETADCLTRSIILLPFSRLHPPTQALGSTSQLNQRSRTGGHDRRLTNALDAAFPSFVSAQNFDFHSQIIDRKRQWIDCRKANRILFRSDDRAHIAANTTLQKCRDLSNPVAMMIGELSR